MSKFWSAPVSRKLLAAVCLIALLVSLIPPLALSFYNHASYDDLGYSIRTHDRWRETGSFWQTVRAAAENTASIRYTWQGTFSSCFLAALQPALFGEGLYWLTTWVLIGLFLLALGALTRQLVCRTAGAGTAEWLILFSLSALVMMQLTPSISEAYFWWNGGMVYSAIWCFWTLRTALWLRLESCRKGRIPCALALAFLSVVTGGGNFVTPLLGCATDALLLLCAFRKKEKTRFVKLGCFLLMLAAFAYSITAPGNAVRGQTLSGGMSAPKAILESFYFGLALMSQYFSPALAALWLAAALLLKDKLAECSCSFRYPLLAAAVFVCLYCCQLTPTLYTGNYLGDGRAQVLQYYNYVLLSTLLVLYLTGWALKKKEVHTAQSTEKGEVQEALPSAGVIGAEPLTLAPRPFSRAGAALTAVLLVLGMMSFQRPDEAIAGWKNTLTGSTFCSLLNGQAAAFEEQMTRRDAEMNDPSRKTVQLEPAEDIPEAFMGEVLDTDMKDYVLSLYAEYYQKDSVTLQLQEKE